ncbi:MAG: hypothetical protein U0T83_08190 [Bacteriovoracaceae bacterium]
MKNLGKLLLATSMLSLSTLSFAKELEGSIRGEFIGVYDNKINSVTLPLPVSGFALEVITGRDGKVEGYAGGGLNFLFRTDNTGKALVHLKTETGARYKINDSIKVGGGLKYSYNFAGTANPNESFHDLSVTAHGRYTKKNNNYFQLEVNKSVTDAGGFGANVSYGQAF